ncbi:malonyl-CoA decarboxylase [Spizellomyces sp. 'palustris']|nr:malonyl-CoA decarboxylase [Spizellomyces sp. 'palustris']
MLRPLSAPAKIVLSFATPGLRSHSLDVNSIAAKLKERCAIYETERVVTSRQTTDSVSAKRFKRTESAQPIPQLASTVVTNYWDDVMKFSREPGLYTLGHPTDSGGETPSDTMADHGNLSVQDDHDIRRLLRRTISTRREQGDILPSLLARQCCEFYEGLDLAGRANFLRILGRDFDVNREAVAVAAHKYLDARSAGKGDKGFMRTEEILRQSLQPLYEKFFERINQLPGGMQFLVNMRANVLEILGRNGNDPYLRGLSDSLKSQLQGWFGIGFLDLERITWNSPATVLEKIVRYEAVHAVPTWQALKQRLGPGRLCYSFFHRGMPQEPLTFVQVALVNEIAEDVQVILNDPSPEVPGPTVAIFYSISSSQRGLSGVDLGNFLIKRVVKEIQQFLPSIKTFCTLSPIPRFRQWLETRLNSGNLPSGEPLLLGEEVEALKDLMGHGAAEDGILILKDILAGNSWYEDPNISQTLKPILLRLCARYLLLEKKRSFALDPVCNFHIRNGACMHRLNWNGDASEKGLSQSYGIMVNYNYVLPEVETNNQLYLLDGTIAVMEPADQTLEWAVGTAADGGKDFARLRLVKSVGDAQMAKL